MTKIETVDINLWREKDRLQGKAEIVDSTGRTSFVLLSNKATYLITKILNYFIATESKGKRNKR
jgi:hypothetical protein